MNQILEFYFDYRFENILLACWTSHWSNFAGVIGTMLSLFIRLELAYPGNQFIKKMNGSIPFYFNCKFEEQSNLLSEHCSFLCKFAGVIVTMSFLFILAIQLSAYIWEYSNKIPFSKKSEKLKFKWLSYLTDFFVEFNTWRKEQKLFFALTSISIFLIQIVIPVFINEFHTGKSFIFLLRVLILLLFLIYTQPRKKNSDKIKFFKFVFLLLIFFQPIIFIILTVIGFMLDFDEILQFFKVYLEKIINFINVDALKQLIGQKDKAEIVLFEENSSPAKPTEMEADSNNTQPNKTENEIPSESFRKKNSFLVGLALFALNITIFTLTVVAEAVLEVFWVTGETADIPDAQELLETLIQDLKETEFGLPTFEDEISSEDDVESEEEKYIKGLKENNSIQLRWVQLSLLTVALTICVGTGCWGAPIPFIINTIIRGVQYEMYPDLQKVFLKKGTEGVDKIIAEVRLDDPEGIAAAIKKALAKEPTIVEQMTSTVEQSIGVDPKLVSELDSKVEVVSNAEISFNAEVVSNVEISSNAEVASNTVFHIFPNIEMNSFLEPMIKFFQIWSPKLWIGTLFILVLLYWLSGYYYNEFFSKNGGWIDRNTRIIMIIIDLVFIFSIGIYYMHYLDTFIGRLMLECPVCLSPLFWLMELVCFYIYSRWYVNRKNVFLWKTFKRTIYFFFIPIWVNLIDIYNDLDTKFSGKYKFVLQIIYSCMLWGQSCFLIYNLRKHALSFFEVITLPFIFKCLLLDLILLCILLTIHFFYKKNKEITILKYLFQLYLIIFSIVLCFHAAVLLLVFMNIWMRVSIAPWEENMRDLQIYLNTNLDHIQTDLNIFYETLCQLIKKVFNFFIKPKKEEILDKIESESYVTEDPIATSIFLLIVLIFFFLVIDFIYFVFAQIEKTQTYKNFNLSYNKYKNLWENFTKRF